MLSRKPCAISTYCKFVRYIALNRSPNMEGVYVRCVPTEEKMQITVNYKADGRPCKAYNMDRLQIEEIGKTLSRLKASILKNIIKKKKRKTEQGSEPTPEPDLNLRMTIQGISVENEKTPINKVFVDGAVLQIEDQDLPVQVNLPSVLELVLPENIMAGFPIYPKIEVEFCDKTDCMFTWHRQKVVQDETHKDKTTEIIEEVAKTFSYTSSPSDIGYKLKLTCIAKHGDRCGAEFSKLSKCGVEAGPGPCPFEKRHLFTESILDDDRIRVVCYNLLADVYADSDFTRNELFPYCPPYALHIDYRKQLMLKEITGYNGDIICLQEVDRKIHNRELQPALEALGFEGVFMEKGGQVSEGESIFYRKSKFRQVEDFSIEIRKVINEDEKFTEIKEKVGANETLKKELDLRGTIAQVLVLESLINPGCRLCVANTHLFFHPMACCIRSLQAITIIKHLEHVLLEQNSKGYRTSLILCGDFNCTPSGGAYEFITKQHIGSDNYSWSNNPDFAIEEMHFTHSLELTSGCGIMEYTNYANKFKEQLDYIFIDPSFKVTAIVPNPDHAEVEQHTALPSVVFPSDHIAQICDLEWKFILE